MAEANRRRARRLRSEGLASVVAAVALCTGHAAKAQEDVQAQSVSERAHPDYSVSPLQLGSFEVRPLVNVDARYDDNIYFVASERQDDVIVTVQPSLTISRTGPGQRIAGTFLGSINRYLDHPSENRYGYSSDISGEFGIGGPTQYKLQGHFERTTEQRRNYDSLASSSSPIAFSTLDLRGGVTQQLGRFTMGLEGRYNSRHYAGSVAVSGIDVDLDFRDYEIVEGTARLSYLSGPNQRIYVQVVGNRRMAATPPVDPGLPASFSLDRSSKGGRAEIGLTLQVSELLYLDIRAGYLQRQFDDPSLRDISGLSFRSTLLWNLTPLTSVKFLGVRQVDETMSPLIAGTMRTEFSAKVDHELLRNLVLSAEGRYANLDPIGDQPTSTETEFTLSSRYLLDRRWSFYLEANHFARDTTSTISENRLIFRVKFAF